MSLHSLPLRCGRACISPGCDHRILPACLLSLQSGGCRRSASGVIRNESCRGRWTTLSLPRQSEGALMVQIAEQDTAANAIEATLSYFVDTEAMPVTLVGAPGASDVRTGGGKAEARRAVIRNGRLRADQ